MAGQHMKTSQVGLEGFDSEMLQDSDPTKNVKMDLNKTDMLQLLSYLESELQARDVAIAQLKSEKAKHFLYQAKYGQFGLSEPLHALQRDARSNDLCESQTQLACDDPLTQLDGLIATQHRAQRQMKEQLESISKRFCKVCTELVDEKWKHAREMQQGDSVAMMLEKDRERLKQELETEKIQNRKTEKQLKKAAEDMVLIVKHKSIAERLVRRRIEIAKSLSEICQRANVMESTVKKEKDRTGQLELCLAEKRNKSLEMEASLKTQLGQVGEECLRLRTQLANAELQNREMQCELERLGGNPSVVSKVNGPVLHNNLGANVASDSLHQSMHAPILSAEHPSALPVPSAAASRFGASKGVRQVQPGATSLQKSSRVQLDSETGSSSNLQSQRAVSTGRTVEPTANSQRRPMLSTSAKIGNADPATKTSIFFPTELGNVPRKASPVSLVSRGTHPPIPPNKPQLVIGQPVAASNHPADGVISHPVVSSVPSKPQPLPKTGVVVPQSTRTIEVVGNRVPSVTGSLSLPPVSSSQTNGSRLTMVVEGSSSQVSLC